ncbi:MAG: DUF3536 domain-containing protein [Saprospiraceae bacterium]|nr:DUF3536 domain-containing protein [Saprospiraceae bacterium]
MGNKNKFVCIHGHFYQPPRENAWLEAIEQQDSAAPFHDWNERINFECYAPNASSRILDDEGFIVRIVNNYAKISFNFGPTLLSWMEIADPLTYQSIQEADRQSIAQQGFGSAIAQVHSHLILPLANRRDKETQVIWGIKDFEHRFQRKPDGMWLAETAVDTETLEVLAEQGIRFTILAPRQAKAVRAIGTEPWEQVDDRKIETRVPYLCKLPSGREITLFFYNGRVSQGVAFDGLLNNGKDFARRILETFSEKDRVQLVHIATDGESYGHHHRYGEMALSSCIEQIDKDPNVELTNYAAFLDKHPAKMEAQIHENSSWSCAHGVERWRSNCGCQSGGNPDWNQKWRKPLRETLNWLRDQLVPIFESNGEKLLKDVWAARNDFINVILDRRPEVVHAFLDKHTIRPLDEEEIPQLLRLLEMQRNALLMFTSCGWFFDEISGIETLQILQYANRAIYYARQVSGIKLHPEFLELLEKIPSNVDANAAESYRKSVMPTRVNLDRVGMHYATTRLFNDKGENELDLFNYRAKSEVFHREIAGNHRLAVGRTMVESKITWSRKDFSFAVLYLGQQNIIGNISISMDRKSFDTMEQDVFTSFNRANLGEVIGHMQQYFGPSTFSIWHLFRDEKRKILKDITDRNLARAGVVLREIYNDNYQLMGGIKYSGIPIPDDYLNAVRSVLTKDLLAFFQTGILHVDELERLANEFVKWNVKPSQRSRLNLAASDCIFRELTNLEQTAVSLPQLHRLIRMLETLPKLGLEPDIWQSQNLYFSLVTGFQSGSWVFSSPDWEQAFVLLGSLLRVKT